MKTCDCFFIGSSSLFIGFVIGLFLLNFINIITGTTNLKNYKSPSIEEAVSKCEKNLSRNLYCIGVYTATVEKK